MEHTIEVHFAKSTALYFLGLPSRGGKGQMPKCVLWQAYGWQCGEYPFCCRRNAECYHPYNHDVVL